MQFIVNGPNIPEELLQAHEDGRVVFFCGSGISCPAGLPGFKGLVDEIYRILGTNKEPIEQEAYDHFQYDATLGLLERRFPGQRIAVRNALVKVLKPKLRRKRAMDTHLALLQLGRDSDGMLRLVTTNFDRIFEYAAKHTKQPIKSFAAPMFPIPKNSRWNGLVYLHGLLPDKKDESELNRLVLTSGDFGLAYLTERWAARFVSEMFRNYVVCFVGYSINDPVLRYMMDALAADRMLGEVTPQAYAFAHFESGQENSKNKEWKAKGVTPILYEIPSGKEEHSALHKTLKAWAETYRYGVLGKERIVAEYALARPSASTQQDNFIDRMLWAISDESGLPAKRFAELNPVPSLEWLNAFSEDRFRCRDLSRFGVFSRNAEDDKLQFSLIHRPASYTHSPWMSLLSGRIVNGEWDDVMKYLARWLVRHLNDPELIIWLAQRGGQLHDHLKWMVNNELHVLDQLKHERKGSALDEIRKNAPNAIPSPQMRKLWGLLLSGQIRSPWPENNLYQWMDRFKRDGFSTNLRLELRELLSPKIALSKPFRWTDGGESSKNNERLKELVDWELVLARDHAYATLKDINNEQLQALLPVLLDDFQQLLRDALDLLHDLGEADEKEDRSYWDLPSISPHWQNRYSRDWVALIELLRDSWLAIRKKEPERATRIALAWFDMPYPTFKRLALFAASIDSCITFDHWVDWLIKGDAWWLWSFDTQRETMRLLALQGSKLSPKAKAKLESAILKGPPRIMYRDDLEPERWRSLVERSIWHRIAKLQSSGATIGSDASKRLRILSKANPRWKLEKYERDEFSHWISGSGDPDYEEKRKVDKVSPKPRKRIEWITWLQEEHKNLASDYLNDVWRFGCRHHPLNTGCALCDLSQEKLWPKDCWKVALQVWSENPIWARYSWRFFAQYVMAIPAPEFQKLAYNISWWLETVSKSMDRHEPILFGLCERLFLLSYQDDMSGDKPVFRAINHPVGLTTQALLNILFKRKPDDNDRLPKDIEPFFSQLCDILAEKFQYGRVILASQLVTLFRIDRTWTEEFLLPLFNWEKNPVEANFVWQGFLRSPRIYIPLLTVLKKHFLNTAYHYKELGEYSRQYAAFLTYVALDHGEIFVPQDFTKAIEHLPQEGLEEVAQTLCYALEGAGEKREDYWQNRIQPFWQRVWPKSRDLTTEKIAESLARLSIAARGEFPNALSAVIGWLQPIEVPFHIVHLLHESGLPNRFPVDALRLLNAMIDNQFWPPQKLGKCLDAISQIAPDLLQDPRYKKLDTYARQKGVR